MTSLVQHIHSPSDWQRIVFDPETDKLQVFDFYGAWCGPCKAMEPVIETMAVEYKGKVTFYKVNSDELPDLSRQQLVSALPTFVFYRHGERVGQYVGANPKGLKEKLESLL